MRVLLLGQSAKRLKEVDEECIWHQLDEPLTEEIIQAFDPDLLVSFGYRHIIPPRLINRVNGSVLNLHISLLPWNRGADPNLWSWLENTPRGVSIHWIDSGLDTGPLVSQASLTIDPASSLRNSYEALIEAVANLFSEAWPAIRSGEAPRLDQIGRGTYHRLADKDPHMHMLGQGWETSCAEVLEYGRNNQLWIER